jgi:hypothetical protein
MGGKEEDAPIPAIQSADDGQRAFRCLLKESPREVGACDPEINATGTNAGG